ncbi:hypothetical protein SLS57_007874 [Botryosphaeria dothidea]
MATNFCQRALTAAVALIPFVHAAGITLQVEDSASIKAAAAIAANGLMKLYVNNATGTTPIKVGTFDKPIYWWEAGAVWGGLVDYWSYTGDASYVSTTTQALLAQKGPANDFMNVEWEKELGNDDQVFWALAAMSAAEQDFPSPASATASDVSNPPASWLELAVNTFNTQIARWDTATCNGGLRWQIYSTNNGYTYKNSISNGGLFQLAARLHRATGNATYATWATRVWDWSVGVGAIDAQYNIFDGAGVDQNCTQFDKTQWSYNVAMYLYGAAALYNTTDGAEPWATHTRGLLANAAAGFFGPSDNASQIAFERACEPIGTCNTDQLSFKAYLARWMAKTSVLAPAVDNGTVAPLLRASALGAAAACSGEADGTSCGFRWDINGYDGKAGVGPQLAAMEVIQALLVHEAPAPGASGGEGTTTPSVSAAAPAPTTLLTSTRTTPTPTTTTAPTTPAPAATTPANTAAAISRLLPLVAAAAAKAQPADAMF